LRKTTDNPFSASEPLRQSPSSVSLCWLAPLHCYALSAGTLAMNFIVGTRHRTSEFRANWNQMKNQIFFHESLIIYPVSRSTAIADG
jgi:hypothetical protein